MYGCALVLLSIAAFAPAASSDASGKVIQIGDKSFKTPADDQILWIDLTRASIGDEELAQLGTLTCDISLDLTGAKITVKGAEILPRLKTLRGLRIDGQAVTEEMLKLLGRLASLKKLDVDCRSLTVRADAFAGLKDLEDLAITASYNRKEVNRPFLEFLAPLARLKNLDLAFTWCDGSELAQLSNCQNLESLRLTTLVKISETGLEHLKTVPKLRSLVLENCLLGDKSLEQLGQLAQLRELKVSEIPRKYRETLATIGTLTNLTKLSLRCNQLTDDDLAPLAGLLKLSELDLMAVKLQGNGLVHFEKMADLRTVKATVKNGDEALRHLRHCKKLETIDFVFGAPGVSDESIAAIRELRKLRSANLSASTISDAFVDELGKLPDVRTLFLGKTKITDKSMSSLLRIKDLKQLYLTDCTNISKESIARVTDIKTLEDLRLDGTKVDDAALTNLQNLLKLERIALARTQIGKRTLERVLGLPKIKSVTVSYGDNLTEHDVAALRKSHPHVLIADVRR